MHKFILLSLCLPLIHNSFCQNVGIGTSSPTGPLSFSNSAGNKIVLWGNGNNPHYGIGIQSASLQLYSDLPVSNILFGYGSSSAFNERMRIINTGGDGLELKGRIHLKNGTSPLNPDYGSGVWLYKPDNTSAIGFMGVQNSKNIGFFGGPAGWGFTYDATTSRVGIGNANPNAPLSFPPSLGKKITLYPGATGDVGFGVAGNRLQIYSDNPFADVAIGYDAAGTFMERFAVKPNGALALNGNIGSPGQVLSSAGGNPALWSAMIDLLPIVSTEGNLTIFTNNSEFAYSGGNINLNITQNSKVLIFATVKASKSCIVGPCNTSSALYFRMNNNSVANSTYSFPAITWPAYNYDNRSFGPLVLDFAPGNYTLVPWQFLSVGAPMSFNVTTTTVIITK